MPLIIPEDHIEKAAVALLTGSMSQKYFKNQSLPTATKIFFSEIKKKII